MTTFQEKRSIEERQCYIASLLPPRVNTSCTVPNVEQESLTTEDTIDKTTTGNMTISTACNMVERSSCTTQEGPQDHQLYGEDEVSTAHGSNNFSPIGEEREKLSTVLLGIGRGRGRGRGLSLSAFATPPPGVTRGLSMVGPSMAQTTRVGGRGIGRGRGGAIVNKICTGNNKNYSMEWEIGCLGRGSVAEAEESNRSDIQHSLSELETSVEVTDVEAMGGGSRMIAEERECDGEMSGIGEFNDSFQLTSTPAHTVSQNNRLALSATADSLTCRGCKDLEACMELKIAKLSAMVSELRGRIDEISSQKSSKASNQRVDEIFTDKRIMRVKAAAFVTGRPLSAHMFRQLVLNIYDNEPPSSFDYNDIKLINDRRECRDAPSLSKWSVFEMFSIEELVGRNCLGGGHDILGGVNGDVKKPFDEFKMQIIKTAVFSLYPQQSDSQRKSVWIKCVEKVNTDVRYLLKVSMKKHEWLHLE